jgi:hypothetical protein
MSKWCFLKTTTALLFVTGFQLCHASKLSTDLDGSHLQKETTTTTRALQKRIPFINERDLQASNFAFRANYTAQFQYLHDPLCIGPTPVIQVYCFGPNIQLLSTSDPSIQCSMVNDVVDGWSTIECNNTCASDTACEQVYLNLGGTDIKDGPFGKINFQCEGDELSQIDAAVSFLDSGNGTCAAAADSRNLHVARMGVSCPTPSGSREYDFDDYYFDCSSYGTPVPGDGNPGNLFTCINGQNCYGEKCETDFDQMYIDADTSKFQDTCVEPVVPLAPTPVPVLNTTGLFTFSARFEAAWGLWFDPLSNSAFCSGGTPTVRITCLNGNNIALVNKTYETIKCTTVSSGEMDCTDNNSTDYVNNFTGVVYVSGDDGLWGDCHCWSRNRPSKI